MILWERTFFRCSENTVSRKNCWWIRVVYVQEEKLYPTLEEFTSSSNECLNKLGSPLAKWSEKKVPGSEMTPQTNFSQMRSSHQTNSLVTPRCKLSPAPGRRRISPGHLFNHRGSLSDIRIRSIFQHQNCGKRACYIFSHIFRFSYPSHLKL